MSKGIRPAVEAKFVELAPKRIAGEFGKTDTCTSPGNTEFRRSVMQFAMSTFGIGVPSAATAYNTALKAVRVKHPELCVNLGRSEDKKGGRKPGTSNNAPAETPAAGETTPAEAALAEANAAAEAAKEQAGSEQAAETNDAAPELPEQPAAETGEQTPAAEVKPAKAKGKGGKKATAK